LGIASNTAFFIYEPEPVPFLTRIWIGSNPPMGKKVLKGAEK
jgi:hypothetical protein